MSVLKTTLENLAHRIAAAKRGRISPSDLIPYLPVSLSMIEKHLDEMVDDCVVRYGDQSGLKTYEFTELLKAPPKPMSKGVCVYCGDEASVEDAMPLCYACTDALNRELLKLAESTAWPSEAVWQQELLYITSTARGPIHVTEIAGRSRLPLNQMKLRLGDLVERGFARQIMDPETNTQAYEFPPIRYQRNAFLRQDKFIRLHPSSLKDEMEVKIIKSLVALISTVGVTFLLAFIVHIPLFLLALGMGPVGALAVWRIFRRKVKIEPSRIDKD